MESENAGVAPARSGAQAVERAFAVLGCFESEPELGVTQLARALDLSVSTTHRLLRALCRGGWVAHDAATGRYHLGSRVVALGGVASRQLGVDATRPELERLAAETGEGVLLGVLDAADSLVVASVPGPRTDAVPVATGERGPAHACAMGKTLIAFDDTTPRPPWPLARLTPRTITDPAVLALQLRRIRERGWAANDEEITLGVRGIGAPVFDAAGRATAAISVAVPAHRLSRAEFPATAIHVLACASKLRGVLGHPSRT